MKVKLFPYFARLVKVKLSPYFAQKSCESKQKYQNIHFKTELSTLRHKILKKNVFFFFFFFLTFTLYGFCETQCIAVFSAYVRIVACKIFQSICFRILWKLNN